MNIATLNKKIKTIDQRFNAEFIIDDEATTRFRKKILIRFTDGYGPGADAMKVDDIGMEEFMIAWCVRLAEA